MRELAQYPTHCSTKPRLSKRLHRKEQRWIRSMWF